MKVPTIHAADAVLLLSLLLAPLPTVAMLNCESVVADKQIFNLKALGGPHSIMTSRILDGKVHNMTYTVDICRSLGKKKGAKKGEECPNGTRVCAIKRVDDHIDKAIPIAGELRNFGGGDLDHEVTRLKTSDSNSDSKKEGVLLVMKGGFDRTDSGVKRKQRAIIEFLCDKDRNGTEGEYDPADDKYEPSPDPAMARLNPLLFRAEDGDGDGGDDNGDGDGDDEPPKEVQLGLENDPSLKFNSYEPLSEDRNIDVLRLTWLSKYACENRDNDDSGESPSSHWGFFTWLVIIVFLGTAAYLVFGSWLNYNRYGARGWDLIPHGDTIRDIPYLLKDWTRRVLNTVQGSGSRGGYSAV
ncbi:autophagy-related protein 27 [Daldinia loculata]|uniref:autophagy-related protein 27 n=1 Tax=Daldinia loculata TaxID=103429 RepID=UPI0020C3E405|nr:autophagy-related protein 27 [Daldinia loculata]KAI1652044.1 autophagy-related protein 27 [Daldinia loculata]KAI2784157.1 autophagy-related protein 27 [Daldinia loculata]